MSKGTLYTIVLLACFAGYGWLSYNLANEAAGIENTTSLCLVKHATTLPCPSCGSTRSLVSFFNGDFTESLYWNPMGLLLVIIMLVAPLWIGHDLARRKSTFHYFYRWTEKHLQQKTVAIPLVAMVVLNWIWNISKGL